MISNGLILVAVCFLGLVAGQVIKIENKNDPTEYKHCHSLFEAGYTANGTYMLVHDGEEFLVRCEMVGKWGLTGFLYRSSSDVNFDRSYQFYANGFGDILRDYFAGLRLLNKLTSCGQNVVETFFEDWNGQRLYSKNTGFHVGDRSTGFRLSVGHQFLGNVKDDLIYNDGAQFYASDHHDPHHCIDTQKGGWWYKSCTLTLPTGHYYNYGPYYSNKTLGDGIYWADYKGSKYSLKKFAMVVRPWHISDKQNN